MRKPPVLAVLGVLLCVSTAFASDELRFSPVFDQAAWEAHKLANVTGDPKPIGEKVGGDDLATATVIPGIPYMDTGNTCAFNDNYQGSCLTNSSPDVVYAYSPVADVTVDVTLCNSLYDTAVWIYMNDQFTEIACNDDYCGLQSGIEDVFMAAGNTYYIVIAGYSTGCGDYELIVQEPPPPPECPPCPTWAEIEGEVDCYTDYDDNYNGGCNSTPPVFQPIMNCDHFICGTTGVYMWQGLTYRDTDWFEITLPVDAPSFTATLWSEVPGAVAILDASCTIFDYCFSSGTEACEEVVCGPVYLTAGSYYIFVSTAGWDLSWACGSNYVLSITGTNMGPSGVETTSWGSLRTLFQ